MPRLVTVQDPVTLARSVAAMHKRFRFLVAVSLPDIARGGVVDSASRLALYGSEVSCTDALIEAVGDFPGCERYGEYTYLPHTEIARIVADAKAADPLAQSLKSLGIVDPSGKSLL